MMYFGLWRVLFCFRKFFENIKAGLKMMDVLVRQAKGCFELLDRLLQRRARHLLTILNSILVALNDMMNTRSVILGLCLPISDITLWQHVTFVLPYPNHA